MELSRISAMTKLSRTLGKRSLAIIAILSLIASLVVVQSVAVAAPGRVYMSMIPQSQTLARGTTAKISVSLTSFNTNVSGVKIHYTVSGANSGTGTVTTNSSGDATISYYGARSGTDTVTAYADLNNDGNRDFTEPQASATVIWSLTNASLTLTPSSQSATPGTTVSIAAHFSAPNANVGGVAIRYSVTGVNTLSNTVTTDSSGNATISYTGSGNGTDTISAYADFNNDGSQGTGEPSATAKVIWGGSTLSLAPSSQTRLINTQVSISATYLNVNGSSSGATIRYSVSGANSTSGTATTDANGDATITYTGSKTGTDTITAYVDTNNNGSQGSNEPGAQATVTWTATVNLSLQPAAASIGAGTTGYIAVSLTSSNGGVAGIPIRYQAVGANPLTGSMTTDANGNTVISIPGPNAGSDTVTAYADLNNNGSQDTGEPTATTTITWTPTSTQPSPPPTTFQAAQPASPKSGCTYFTATKHNLCAGFQAYWNQFGGLGIFGMPLTEEFQLNGVTTQIFERAEFQWFPGAWPSHFDVELGLLGNQVTAGRGNEAPFQTAIANSGSDCSYYSATGHNLCGDFAAFWRNNGGLAIFGYPISEPFQEVNPDNGQTYTVQYFQRSRFELHPGQSGGSSYIELGRLGAQVLQTQFGVNP